MSMTLAGILGASAAAGSSVLGQTGLLSYGTSKKLSKYNYKLQKRYDKFKSALDYDYAQRYAENSAKWSSQGLLNAGFNPILAATDGNFSGTFGQPSTGGPSPSSARGGGNAASDAIGAANALAQMRNTAKQNELLDAQVKNVEQDTANKKATGGLSGDWAALSSVLQEFGVKDWLKNKLNQTSSKDATSLLPATIEVFHRIQDNDAKSSASNAARKVEDIVKNLPSGLSDDEKRKRISNALRDRNRENIYRRERERDRVNRFDSLMNAL